MSVLVLVLAGPLQAWGLAARWAHRPTEPQPTKSGVIGLLGAACGLDRADTAGLARLAALTYAVRTDQPGHRLRDFHTTHSRTGKAMPLSNRFYLADAVFTAALAGPTPVMNRLHQALRSPVHPLFLGRRSCPPARPVAHSLHHDTDDPVTVLEHLVSWQAAGWFQQSHPGHRMTIHHDTHPTDPAARLANDHPLDFTPGRRRHAPRATATRALAAPQPADRDRDGGPDFFDALDDLT
ncbi:type I-E CRISPR-associated protein Cas5/CasD [Streptomyces yaizuensis]|uniref:Type I-E CRISPR-associated protein Cas5/CasD n=1 Tax=Streptomyces yaizuensis TaxID=2989713 RepID=A0ABQ5P6R1_9ACTN|nr:type I-E CRISPR-associated protein Cas5/CasD [Streptomyces sp. YSPA8]GLF98165.1 type I-E CRISPR-associated protein Cas5/CasD [Streptomyces sp. YSPA8]